MPTVKQAAVDRFSKTEAGREEIRTRTHTLSRSARNLLLILDDTRPATEWLTMVQGASPADLQALMQARLVEPVRHPPQSLVVESAANDSRPPRDTMPPSQLPTLTNTPVTGLTYAELYAGLNEMVREQLGLFKGYRFTLDIERASGLAELEAVAVRFADAVEKANGEAAGRLVRRALSLPT